MLDHRRFKLLGTGILSLLFSIISYATPTSESTVLLRDGSQVSNVKSYKRKMSDIELSLLTFTIGSSKLSDVKEKLGNGIIYHEGDAGNSLYVLCYEGPDGSIVTFESGEMGGTEHVITSGAIFSAKYTYRLKRHCSKLSLVNRNLKLADIRIGDSTTAVKKVKGVPSKDVKGLLIYSYETQELTTKGQADIISSVEVSFNSGKVSSIAVSKIESY